MKASPPTLAPIALVIANTVPVIGVFMFGWDAGDLLTIYWLETVVVTLFAYLRVALVTGDPRMKLKFFLRSPFVLLIPVAFYGFFVFVVTNRGPADTAAHLSRILSAYWLTTLSFVVSHGISFVQNFLGRERALSNVNEETWRPHKRFLVMQFSIGVGLWVWAIATGSPVDQPFASANVDAQGLAFVLGLFAVKTSLDLASHLVSHREYYQ